MRIEIRTTPEEKRHWQEIAENKGVTLSNWCAHPLRFAPAEAPGSPKGGARSAAELARIGNNLNQLAHAANRRRPLKRQPF